MKKIKLNIDKKRSAVYSVVGLMLFSAVYLNWNYTSDLAEVSDLASKNYGESVLVDNIDPNAVSSVSYENVFADAKLSRQQSRDEALSILNSTVNSETATEEAKTLASSVISVMSENTLCEGSIESLIQAKGFAESVVFISETGVNVLINKGEDEFTAVDASVVKDIVISETGVSADKIKIVEGN